MRSCLGALPVDDFRLGNLARVRWQRGHLHRPSCLVRSDATDGSGLGRMAGAGHRDRFVRVERRRARGVSAGGDEDRQACFHGRYVRLRGIDRTFNFDD
ncbi:MAG: hypothetical protein DME06_03980, partial [Candidatus Rokuibacteriota bacterium]